MASVDVAKNNFLIKLLVTVIIMAVFVFLFIGDLQSGTQKTQYVIKFDTSMCPANGWVDCMPTVDSPTSFMCEESFLAWAEENCSGFQGAAL